VAYAYLGWTLAFTRKVAGAIEAIEEVLRLSPSEPAGASWFSLAGFAAFIAERYDEGIEWTQRGREGTPDHPGDLHVLAANCGQAGRIKEGRVAVVELNRVAPEITVESTRAQMPFENPADLEGLRKVGLPES
jgi:hypothetical protein